MELYKGKNWEVVYVDWCQEFVGQCIVSSNKESLSELTKEEWVELGELEKELERVCTKLFNTGRLYAKIRFGSYLIFINFHATNK